MSTAVSSVSSASAICTGGPGAPMPDTPAAASLLPSPVAVGGDAMMAMLTMMSKAREVGRQGALARVSSNSRERKEAIARELRAFQEAARARESGGFWGKVKSTCSALSKVATVVAAGAAVVASGGAGAPFALAIAGAALSAGAYVQGETKLLQSLGVSDEAAGWVELGMTAGSAACTIGSSVAAGAASKAARAGNQVARSIKTVEHAATIVQCASTVVGGIATIKQGDCQADAEELMADGLSARLARERLDRMLRQLLGDLEQEDDSAERAMGSLRQAIDVRGNTLMTASMMRA